MTPEQAQTLFYDSYTKLTKEWHETGQQPMPPYAEFTLGCWQAVIEEIERPLRAELDRLATAMVNQIAQDALREALEA